MIPVSLPGGNFYVLMAVSLACLSTLLTWLAVLATTRSARRWLGGHRRTGATLLALLAVIGSIFPYQQFSIWFAAQRDAQADAGRKTVLAQATRLAGVEMPAGTELRLATPGDLGSFDRAVFPETQPASILGISATRLFRYPANARQPETLSAEIARDQALDGWLCAHGHRVEFALHDGNPHFASCHLAIGNTLGQQPVPRAPGSRRSTPPRRTRRAGCCAPRAAARWKSPPCRCSRSTCSSTASAACWISRACWRAKPRWAT